MNLIKFFYPVKEITWTEAETIITENPHENILIDVRQPEEYNVSRVEGAMLIPIFQLFRRSDELSCEKIILLYCRSGSRSRLAARILKYKGFDRVFNISGGILAYEQYQ